MCLAVPGKIVDIHSSGGMKMGNVDFGGVTREVCLEAVPEVQIGNYVIVHAGFALSVLAKKKQKTHWQHFVNSMKLTALWI